MNHKNLHQQSGLTLIEIMIAMIIGLILLLGTMSMFISNKRIYREQEQMGRLQENARFAIQKLFEDIRMSGYVGCSDNPGGLTNNVDGVAAGALANFTNIIEGFEEGVTANWLPSGSIDIMDGDGNIAVIQPNTDAITLRYIRGFEFQLQADMALDADTIQVSNAAGFQPNDIVAIHDCAGVDMFMVSGVANAGAIDTLSHAAGTNTTGSLSRTYQTNASVSRFMSKRYYIGTGANGGPSLFDTGTELIEGVENMQILYGEDTTADSVADQFRTVANVANWANVTSVRIALLLRSDIDTNIQPNTNTYSLLGTNVVAPGDQRRRRIVTTTVLIRNRDI